MICTQPPMGPQTHHSDGARGGVKKRAKTRSSGCTLSTLVVRAQYYSCIPVTMSSRGSCCAHNTPYFLGIVG